MKKKIFLNVFFNLGIILCIIGIGWSYSNNSPLVVVFFAAALVALAYVKVQLIKSLNKDFKK